MYISSFELALREFDKVLDSLAANSPVITVDGDVGCAKNDRDCDCEKLGSSVASDIKSVIFNDPATIVTFSDGSKVCVKACSKDTFNKEQGLVYAIIKRLYADGVDENGYLVATGLGTALAKVVDGAVDQKEVAAKAAERKAEKAQRKAAEAKKKDGQKKGDASNKVVEDSTKKDAGDVKENVKKYVSPAKKRKNSTATKK